MSGFLVYSGPSWFTGEPIVGIITLGSGNDKTGNVNSLWILREDSHPVENNDEAICDECPLRGGQGCYVIRAHGSASVWTSYKAGLYGPVNYKVLRRRMLRLGADGDPAALPLPLLRTLVANSDGHLGYTHAWRKRPEMAELCMASAHTLEERAEAKALGFRIYRLGEDEPVKGEAWCPGSAERGKMLQCVSCGVCNGQASGLRGDVFCRPHGANWVRQRYERSIHGRSTGFRDRKKREPEKRRGALEPRHHATGGLRHPDRKQGEDGNQTAVLHFVRGSGRGGTEDD